MDRKAELARKKAKLAAMREERLKKEELQLNISPQAKSRLNPSASGDVLSVDKILQELGMSDSIETNGKPASEELGKSISSPALLSP